MINIGNRESITLTNGELFLFSEEQVLPLVIQPKEGSSGDLLEIANEKEQLEQLLTKYGAILFRGFEINNKETFNNFIEKSSTEALYYSERSSPRHAVYKNIYTSTDHPEDKEIFQHSEQSYNKSFPLRIFFYCEKPAEQGGATPLADARKIYQRIPKEVRDKFEQVHYRYSRCFWQVMGTKWQTAFQTESKEEVERYCTDNDINFEWQPGEALKTYQIRHTTAYHPVSHEPCWFNHCTFFNLKSLDPETQEILECSFEPDELPNQTFYGDGTGIEPEVIETLQNAYVDEKTEFDWQAGDVLMIDNMLVTHGRRSFKGERSVLVGMSNITNWSDVSSPTPN
ncbi:TauD/TfdA family dioxygenase [Paraneptunicella aestuarii]|nr:TauD/TfdA family dioxygenase [Paraneptunicella aestuarii]